MRLLTFLFLTCCTISAHAQTNAYSITTAVDLFNRQEYDKALPQLMSLVDQGNKEAYQYLIRIYYWGGKGIAKNCATCFDWANKGARANDAESQLLLGYMYEKGECGISKNNEQAFKNYKAAALNGHPSGMYDVGRCFENGIGVAKNNTDARAWYEKAMAENNSLGRIQAKDRIAAMNKAEAQERAEKEKQKQELDEMARLHIDPSEIIVMHSLRHDNIKTLKADGTRYQRVSENGMERIVPLAVKLAVTTRFTSSYKLGVDHIFYSYLAKAGTFVCFEPETKRMSVFDAQSRNEENCAIAKQGLVTVITLAEPAMVPFWGIGGSLLIPAGSEVIFETKYFEIHDQAFSFGHRAMSVKLGADLGMGELGSAKKGQRLVSQAKATIRHFNPDIGGLAIKD